MVAQAQRSHQGNAGMISGQRQSRGAAILEISHPKFQGFQTRPELEMIDDK